MQASHTIVPVFDEPNLVSAAGLSPVLALAERAGLSGLLAERFSASGGSAGVKVQTVVAGMLAGADDIDGLDILRAGGMRRLLGPVRAPSTIGTFLRSLTYGHCLQLGAVNRRLVAGLQRMVPSLISSGGGPVLVDLDDTMREVHGYQKQAVAYGYNKTKGLNAILATISTDHSAPVIAQCGLRRGNIRSGANSGWHASRALSLACEVAGDRPVLLRADSAFCMHQIVQAAQQAGCWFSLTIPAWKTVTRAISEIPEDAWEAIEYPHAVFDEEARQWISDAEVAEISFTAFTSRPKAEHVSCRLIVRRVKRLGGARAGQDELFATYRYHAFITNSTLPVMEADQRHRGHAIVEQVIAELKGGPLAHLPSKSFSANTAWLVCAVIAFNLSRAAAHAAGIGKARMATIATDIIRVPGRLASRARRLIVHLPENWPAKHQWMRLHTTANAPPPVVIP